jgi:peptide-methionine (S)-S-oxide reductase
MGNKQSIKKVDYYFGSKQYDEAQVEGKDELIHFNNQNPIIEHGRAPTYPEGSEQIILGMGCCCCSEDLWSHLGEDQGVYSTSVGYFGGRSEAPPNCESVLQQSNYEYNEELNYETFVYDVYKEVVKIVYNPDILPLESILVTFWENHEPSRNDEEGSLKEPHKRSCIYYFTEEQRKIAQLSKLLYQRALGDHTFIATTIQPARHDLTYYYAEEWRQQCDSKSTCNPWKHWEEVGNNRNRCEMQSSGVVHPWGQRNFSVHSSASPSRYLVKFSSGPLDIPSTTSSRSHDRVTTTTYTTHHTHCSERATAGSSEPPTPKWVQIF